MEFAGDEKRVQALFSKLQFEDQALAPEFERFWRRVERIGPAPVRALRKPLIALAAAIIVVVSLVVAWSSYRWSTASSRDQALNISPQTVVSPPPQLAQQRANDSSVAAGFRSRHAHSKKLFRSRQLERTATREAALLSSWQSPTQTFLNSPAAVTFNSLPQLNQSVDELKTFLRN